MRTEKVLLDTPRYKILEKCNVGYEPYFELFIKRRFLFISWHKLALWSLSFATVLKFMKDIEDNKDA